MYDINLRFIIIDSESFKFNFGPITVLEQAM